MKQYSPYLKFSRKDWRKFRKETPMTLSEKDLDRLHGQLEPVSLLEIEEIYLPLSRLLNLYIAATQKLYKVTSQFLGNPAPRVPYIIGISGSVAVGKSTTSRILQALLSRWPNHPHVELVTTDGYLYPTAVLEKQNLMNRKGFPESYDLRRLVQFLSELKSGKPKLQVPLYSHRDYDISPNKYQIIDQPDIVIVEGLNVLQVGPVGADQQMRVFVSDFFDFTIYVDADVEIIKNWFMQRFMLFRKKAKNDPKAFFYRFANLSDQKAKTFADKVWSEINAANLYENILPFKQRAKLILEKGKNHLVKNVYLRKI